MSHAHRSFRFVPTARSSVALLPLALALGCGGPSSEAAPPKAPDADQSAAKASEPGAPGIPWSEKTFAQRQDYMGLEVLPAMKEKFEAFGAEEFADFKCQTCHGDDMKEVKFEMPNDLYALPKENTWQAAMDYNPEITKFMGEVVVPEMAKLLDMQPFDPETGQGFGCFGCHQSE
jgi:hypothetical protein